MSRPIDVLVNALRAEQERGQENIHLDENAKQILRDWHRQAQAAKSGRPVTPASPTSPPPTPA
ncbi:MAG: hypothetical protein ACPG4K_09585, partial [Haloferula sp.]